jgi:hypothetical protein
MPTTYEILATTTLSSTANTYTFSSISQSYTDIRLVANMGLTGQGTIFFRCNSDTGNNYYWEALMAVGSSSTPTSAIQGSGEGRCIVTAGNQQTSSTNGYSLLTVDFMSYTFSLNKPFFYEYGFVPATALYNTKRTACGNYTSGTAISSVSIITDSNFVAGTTFTLFGILKA